MWSHVVRHRNCLNGHTVNVGRVIVSVEAVNSDLSFLFRFFIFIFLHDKHCIRK